MIFGRFAMSNEPADTTQTTTPNQGAKPGRFLGSLKEALAAAGRDDTQRGTKTQTAAVSAAQPDAKPDAAPQKSGATVSEPPRKDAPAAAAAAGAGLSAAEAAREVKGQTSLKPQDNHLEFAAPPTTRVVRGGGKAPEDTGRTRLARGKVEVHRGEFEQDPVVGWVVVVGGPGIGCYRPIFEGNNTVGRSLNQRIPLDFGDDTISSEEQAYIRYDSAARSFLFVPNLAKTNVVSVNDKRPTGAVELSQMDVITVGRTQLVFVPFCGAEFDWAELTDAKS
jgi:FHA domain